MTDFEPTASLENLARRAELLQHVRRFFDERGFLEVTTPLLSRDTVVDRHLEPFRVTVFADPRTPSRGPTWFLQTSPEFHMKRLMAAGATAIYQINQVFRAGEVGLHHNLEFTMLEWYRVGDDMRAAMDLLALFIETVADTPPTQRLSYQQAFQQVLGIDPFSASLPELRRVAEHRSGDVFARSTDRDELLDWLLATRIAPLLGTSHPTIVFDFPENHAALAKIRRGDVNLAERFELVYRGIELANGYHELCSADELRLRIRQTNDLRREDGREALPAESRLLAAMDAGLPACSGVAVGFDRLAMLVLAEEKLEMVVPFGFKNA
jgi:lysyl-tRNA synthetase class 2